MNQKRYNTIRLPRELIDEIDKIVSRRFCGYTSRAEFVKEAVRQHILEVRKKRIEDGSTSL